MNSQEPVLVEYLRSGGITGRELRLVVHADGTARLIRGATGAAFTVPADTLARIRSFLEAGDLDTLRSEYLPSRPGADLYDYVVIIGERRIHTQDTAIPPALQPLIQLLSGLANRPR